MSGMNIINTTCWSNKRNCGLVSKELAVHCSVFIGLFDAV